MIYTTEMLSEKYSNFFDSNSKINREAKKGNLIYIKRGLYETNPNVNGVMLSQFIYGPSYLSFDYVLSFYSVIPEAVYNTYTCATYDKNKKKIFKNVFGTYTYRDIPKAVYNLDVSVKVVGEYSYQIATIEKALCDKLYTISPIKSIKALTELLFEDLRIDQDEFNKLDKNKLLILAPPYHSTNLDFLVKFIKRGLISWNKY